MNWKRKPFSKIFSRKPIHIFPSLFILMQKMDWKIYEATASWKRKLPLHFYVMPKGWIRKGDGKDEMGSLDAFLRQGALVLGFDDEEMIREVLREYAEYEGYEADEAEDGREAVRKCKENDYDIVLMDVMMPKLDGFSAVKEIKKYKDVPVIMLSARGEEYDKLFGFELGVDDYVVKPFSPKEVMARINAVLKRHVTVEKPSDVYTFDGLKIDITARNVYVDGVKADLTPKEYELLFYLVKNKGVALSREKLLTDVWGFDFFGDDRTVDTHIKMLRSNLKEYRKFIVTLRGMGYKFEA